jgi:hypothetical protein
MTTTSDFSKVIECYLLEKAQNDPEFKKKFNAKDKNISDCITYILNVVRATNCQGFTDEEVYQIAINYYEIKDVEVGQRFDAKAVVNHSIDTPEFLRYKITAEEMKYLSGLIYEYNKKGLTEDVKNFEEHLKDLRENPHKYWNGLPLQSYKEDPDNQERYTEVKSMVDYYNRIEEEKKEQEKKRKERKTKTTKKTTSKKPTVKKPEAKKEPVKKTESKFKTPPPVQYKTDKHGQASLF